MNKKENSKIKYGLKINTDFDEDKIKNNTRIININDKEHKIIKEEYLTSKNKENFISHTIINLNVEGASIEFIGRYRGNENLIDVFCKVHHNADNTKSIINIRSIAETGSKIISRTDIFVKENVKGVEGEEKCKYVFVVDEDGNTGEIDTIPALDINSSEVRVSHAVSISKIKKADIWYAGLNAFKKEEAEKFFKENFLN